MNAIILCRRTFTPDAAAATGSSRTAMKARPRRERRI